MQKKLTKKKILFEIRTEYLSFQSLTVIHDVVICPLRDNTENQNHTRVKQILKIKYQEIKTKDLNEGSFV